MSQLWFVRLQTSCQSHNLSVESETVDLTFKHFRQRRNVEQKQNVSFCYLRLFEWSSWYISGIHRCDFKLQVGSWESAIMSDRDITRFVG